MLIWWLRIVKLVSIDLNILSRIFSFSLLAKVIVLSQAGFIFKLIQTSLILR